MDIETLRDDDDDDAECWDELLDAIEQHQVVPVVGIPFVVSPSLGCTLLAAGFSQAANA